MTAAELRRRIKRLEEQDAGGTVFLYPGSNIPDEELKGKRVIVLADDPADYV